MAQAEKHYRWQWTLKSSPQALWPFFADTNRVNRDTGVFPVKAVKSVEAETLTNARHLLRYELPGPFSLEYEEEPFEWVFPYRYGVLRRFRHGPWGTLQVLATLEPHTNDGTMLTYEVWIRPNSIIGSLLSDIVIGGLGPRRFNRALSQYDEIASSKIAPYTFSQPSALASGGQQRLEQMQEQLLAQGQEPALVKRLVALIYSADDMTLARIRPYVYADLWGVSRRSVLELCLWATRIGLLDFQWEVLCPMCRGAEDRVSNRLADVTSEAHCHSCDIDFRTDFENSVELTFAPNPAVRAVERIDYCVAGPEITPHIVAQQLMADGEQRLIQPMLESGRYRLRTPALAGACYFRVFEGDGRALAKFDIEANKQGWPIEEYFLTESPTLTLLNDLGEEALFVLERTAWGDQAATAAAVMSLQRFRDLFANEALRPGEQIGVGSLTILFTDLVDSTRMYREIGDAPAFGLVMNHFDVLKEAIDAEGGSIVKTIGDAVMAAFRQPVAALRAMAQAQSILSNPPDGQRPLYLKAAIHTGPSIAVTLNERLDYFGTTINVAARLEKFSRGNDMIISKNVYADPEVQEFIADQTNAFMGEPFVEALKGFDDQRFELWRLCLNETAVPSPENNVHL